MGFLAFGLSTLKIGYPQRFDRLEDKGSKSHSPLEFAVTEL
jgi:hypothetical protein